MFRFIKIILIPVLAILVVNASNAATFKQCKNSLTLTVLQNLNFGDFVINGKSTIKVSPQGVRTKSNGNAILLGGTVTPAIVTAVSNLPGECQTFPVKVVLRKTDITNGATGSAGIRQNGYDPASLTAFLDASDSITVNYGGKFKALAGQEQGVYSGPVELRIILRRP